MRTNIVLDQKLVKEAFRYTAVKTKRELVEIALREFIENHQRSAKNLLDLEGKIKINSKYDYKKMREGK